MMTKVAKPPRTQKRSAGAWSELAYLCKKIDYWLYERKQRPMALRYLGRLERALRDIPASRLAIVRQEGLALRSELRGELGKSIGYRRREIELMERLHETAREHDDRTKDYLLRDRDLTVLHARRDLLDALVKARIQQNHRESR